MKFLFLLICFVVASQAINDEWTQFKKNFKKVYNNASEEISRVKTYLMNKIMIEQHNARHTRGEVTYRLKLNKFGDLAANEYRFMKNGFRGEKIVRGSYHQMSNQTLPSSLDWRLKGAVTDIKEQGLCGSCWAFSAIGVLESQNFFRTGELVTLSEQNLVDCTRVYGNFGCFGGLMDYAFNYVRDNGGIDTERSYPYTGRDGFCKSPQFSLGSSNPAFVDISAGDEAALQDAVATVGPVAVAIDIGHPSFLFYSDGVFDEPKCSSYNLLHAAVVVGYGTENGQDYWLVKNSWGTSWGDQGYIKMSRNMYNQCGIATFASYPIN